MSKSIGELIDLYLESNPNEQFVVLSDHGVVDVESTIKLDFTFLNSLLKGNDFQYFVDSLYFSVWSSNQTKLDLLKDYLENKLGLHFLDSAYRSSNNLSHRSHGDLIFCAPIGSAFSPNFFGFRCLKSYHGYITESIQHSGIMVSSFEAPGKMRTIDVYNLLMKQLSISSSDLLV